MEIIAIIRYDETNRRLVCSAELMANHVPLYGPHINIKEQITALDMAHKAIEAAIEETNDRLSRDTPPARQ